MIGKRMANALLALLVILGSYKGYLALYDRGKRSQSRFFLGRSTPFPRRTNWHWRKASWYAMTGTWKNYWRITSLE